MWDEWEVGGLVRSGGLGGGGLGSGGLGESGGWWEEGDLEVRGVGSGGTGWSGGGPGGGGSGKWEGWCGVGDLRVAGLESGVGRGWREWEVDRGLPNPAPFSWLSSNRTSSIEEKKGLQG